MLIQQLSIFLENKIGRFKDIAKILGDADINMHAFSVSENADFGVLRLIVSDPEKAMNILKEKNYAVSISDVICISCQNRPGALSEAMDSVTSSGIFIEYMYAFSDGDTAQIILRPNDLDKCLETLNEYEMKWSW